MASQSKVWQFDSNRQLNPTTALDHVAQVLWNLKQLLTGGFFSLTAPWTIIACTDGVTLNTAGVDLWGATYDVTKFKCAASGTAHSWMILRSPSFGGQNFYLCLNLNANTDATAGLQIQMSKTVWVNGTATASPTAPADVWTLWSGLFTDNAFTWPTYFHRMHCGIANDGSFYLLKTRVGTGLFDSVMIVSPLSGTKADDVYPLFTFCRHVTAGSTALHQFPYCLSAAGGPIMRSPTGSAVVDAPFLTSALCAANYATWADVRAGVSVDPMRSEWWDFPVWVYSYNRVRGYLPDFFQSPLNVTTGAVTPLGGTPQFLNAGGVWFPTNAAPVL
jgi:hypothetical protein